jgi:hypothetical protein
MFNGAKNPSGPDSNAIPFVNIGFALALGEINADATILGNFVLANKTINSGAMVFDYDFAWSAISSLDGNYGVAWVASWNDEMVISHF